MAQNKQEASTLSQRRKTPLTPYLLLLPSLALFSAFTFWPFLKTIFLSFSYTDKKGNFVSWAGLKNYVRVITNSLFNKTIQKERKKEKGIFLLTF